MPKPPKRRLRVTDGDEDDVKPKKRGRPAKEGRGGRPPGKEGRKTGKSYHQRHTSERGLPGAKSPVADAINDLRGDMKLQKFAEKTGLKFASAVARLQDPEYQGATIGTLLKIGKACKKKLVVKFV